MDYMKGFKLPGFGNQELKLSNAELNKMTSDRTETTETFDYSAVFMKGKGSGIGYAYPVKWTTPLGETIVGSVMINRQRLRQKKMHMDEFLFTWKDPVGNEQSRIEIEEDFEHDFVVYLTKNKTECNWSKLVTIVEENEVVEFRGLKSTLMAGFINTDKQKRFALEMNNSPTIICNKTMHPTIIQNVYVILHDWDLEFHEVNSVDASMLFQS